MDIEGTLKSIVISLSPTGIDAAAIHDMTDLIQDLDYDSIRMIQLVVAIENQFEFIFDDEMLGIDFLVKFQNLVEYVSDKVREVTN